MTPEQAKELLPIITAFSEENPIDHLGLVTTTGLSAVQLVEENATLRARLADAEASHTKFVQTYKQLTKERDAYAHEYFMQDPSTGCWEGGTSAQANTLEQMDDVLERFGEVMETPPGNALDTVRTFLEAVRKVPFLKEHRQLYNEAALSIGHKIKETK